MRTTTAPQAFELPDELRQDSWLLWLHKNAHDDLWMPRVPLAVIERIRKRYSGQRRTTLINVWIGIRRLLLAMSKVKGNMLSVREIADWSGVSRTRLCGDKGYIQNLLDIGVIGVTVIDDEPLLERYSGRTLYHIDMPALERESLVLLREQFSEKKKGQVPQRDVDPQQRSLFDWMQSDRRSKPDEAEVGPNATGVSPFASSAPNQGAVLLVAPDAMPAPGGAAMVPSGAMVVPSGANCDRADERPMAPSGTAVAPFATGMVPFDAAGASFGTTGVPLGTMGKAVAEPMATIAAPKVPVVVPHDAVGMDGIGMDGKGGEREERPLTLRDLAQILPTILQQAVVQLGAQQQSAAANGEAAKRGPNAPQGEPPIQRWPKELWSLYKRGECDPLELERLELLPAFFDEPSGGHGAYWVSRAILMLTEGERTAPITVPYLRGVLERMRRAGEWSTARLEAPAEEHERTPTHGRERGRTVAANPPLPPRAVVPAAAAAPVVSTTAPAGERTALTIFRQYANGTKLLPEQERQIGERARDMEIWEVVCANWRENGWKFDSVDKMLHRYASLMSERIKEQPSSSDGMSNLERAIYEIPGLSDEERARHCEELMQYVPDDRKRFVDDLRRRCAARSGAEVSS